MGLTKITAAQQMGRFSMLYNPNFLYKHGSTTFLFRFNNFLSKNLRFDHTTIPQYTCDTIKSVAV